MALTLTPPVARTRVPRASSAWLRRATLLYLGLPTAVFLGGWFRPALAWPAVALLVWGGWRAGWRGGDDAGSFPRRKRVGAGTLILGGLLPALALVGMSGAGGWGSGDGDWFKHDTILRDLIGRPWPVVYGTSAGPAVLVYYVSFYLPAALVGKLTGSGFLAGQTLALTMLLGMLLALGWLWQLGGDRTRRGWWRAAGMFFLFSGMDAVGKAAVNLRLGLPVGYGDWNDIEWWAQVFQYSGNAAALFWAPHQALGAWLPLALLLDGFLPPGQPAENAGDGWAQCSLLPLGLSVLWSPFATVGLVPLWAGMLLWRGGWRRWPRSLLMAPANLAGAGLALAGAAYYSARLEPFRVPAWAEVVPGHHPTPLVDGDGVSFPAVYGAFTLLEFGLLAGAVAWAMRREGRAVPGERPLLAITAAVLLVFPLCRYGFANDLVMRGALPALFVLQVLVLRRFTAPSAAGGELRPGRPGWGATGVIAVILAVGAGNAALEYRRHVVRMVRDGAWRDDASRLPVRSLFELQREFYRRPGFDFLRQYLGAEDGFYARRLAPASRPTPAPVAE